MKMYIYIYIYIFPVFNLHHITSDQSSVHVNKSVIYDCVYKIIQIKSSIIVTFLFFFSSI